jgi:hypothetical protein
MKTRATPRRWKLFAVQAVVAGVVFAAGWQLALRSVDKTPGMAAKNAAKILAVKKSGPAAAEVTQAETDLAKILKIPSPYSRQRALLAFVDGLDLNTLQGLMDGLKANLNNGSNREAAMALVQCLANADPRAALAWLRSIPVKYT